MPSSLLILAGDTDGNLGDLALVTATVDAIRRLEPGAAIRLVTSRPDRDQARLGIEPISRGWRGLPALLSAANRADLVICGGGGLFQDDDSLVKMPYWALRLLLLRLFAARMAGLSIGAGPLAHRVSRLFARLALRQLDPISVRDAGARAVLTPLTRRHVGIVPDPAFLLEPASQAEAEGLLREAGVPIDGTPLVGVSLRRWFHTRSDLIPYKYAARLGLRRSRGRREMAQVVANMSAVLDRLAEKTGAHVIFMPTYATEGDAAVCRAVAEKLRRARHTRLAIDDPRLYKAVAGRVAAMLCGRMHAAILAAGQGTPVVGLSYNPKFEGTFALLGQRHRCVPLGDLILPGGAERLAALLLEAAASGADVSRTRDLEMPIEHYIARLLASVRRDAIAEPHQAEP